jgi:hypothetical protein
MHLHCFAVREDLPGLRLCEGYFAGAESLVAQKKYNMLKLK